MKLSSLNLNTVSYKSNTTEQKPVNNPPSQTKPSEDSAGNNYKKTALAVTGLVILGIGIYKSKSIIKGLKKISGHTEPHKPEIKPETKAPQSKPEVKIEVKPESKPEKIEKPAETLKENLPEIKEETHEVLTPEIVYIPPKKPRMNPRKNKSNEIIVIDEKGHILERRPKTENPFNRSNPFNFEQNRGPVYGYGERRTQSQNRPNGFDKTMNVVDDVTDCIILNEMLNHGGSGIRNSMENIAEKLKTDFTPSESGFFENIGESLRNIGESIGDTLHNIGEGIGDTFGDIGEGAGDFLGDLF